MYCIYPLLSRSLEFICFFAARHSGLFSDIHEIGVQLQGLCHVIVELEIVCYLWDVIYSRPSVCILKTTNLEELRLFRKG